MPKVKYTESGGPGVSVMRWRFQPDGRILDPYGNLKSTVPADVAYSNVAKRLAKRGILSIEGYVPPKPKKTEAPKAPKKTETKKAKKETP